MNVASTSARKRGRPPQRTATILVVEDSPVQVELLRRALEQTGYRVFAASNGAEGLAWAKAHRPDAVVTDINMPVMDGYRLCAAIRHDPRLKATPVILLTMLVDPEDVIRGLEAGADAYVTKPYNIPSLISRIESLLAHPPLPPPEEERRKVSIRLGGHTYTVDAHGARMLNLLVSTYENAVLQNRDLAATQQALEDLNQHLEQRVLEQTAALQESEEKFRSIAASAQDALVIMDDAGRIAFWNSAAAKIFGYSAEEALGKAMHALLAPARYHDDFCRGFARFRSTGQGPVVGKTLELAALRKDGTEFPIELSLSAVKLKDQWNAVGIIRDIAERKKSEQGLKLFRTLIDQSNDAIEVLDPESLRFLDVNHEACADLGYSREEMLRLSAFDIDPDLEESKAAEIGKEMRKSGAIIFEARHRKKDGSEFPVEVSASYLELDRPYVLAIVRDISERKHAELALQRANRALRTLSACNQALVRARDESELLNSICRHIVETGGYRMAWVGFPEHDAAKTVRPAAQYGDEQGYLAAVKFSWADTEFGRGPTGTVLRSGSVQINRNFLTDTALAPWRSAALERGYQSSIALPLKSSAGVMGVITINAPEADAFNEAEVTLLQELAEDLAFGIEVLRTRADRDRIAREHLQHAEILRESLEDSIKAIANTLEMRDPYTAGHQRRVADLAVAIAKELGLPEETIHGIALAASIHDLGKISVPAEILAKPAKLTEIESMLIRNHSRAGYDILKDIKFPWPIATMVLQHHERVDGSGYPQGLKGDQILLESRILSVADVVEAMASHRPYRAALGQQVALKELERGSGTAYYASAVDACLRLFAEKRFAFST